MIARLKGKVASKENGKLIVDVSGVGYKVSVSNGTFSRCSSIGDEVILLIHTCVRETDISLYGFMEASEKEIFEKLLMVSGIGPKLAMTILSGIAPHELATSVHNEDLVRLNSISGVGKKTAERIIVDLKDKLLGFQSISSDGTVVIPMGRKDTDLVSALVNLGYHRNQAEQTISQISLRGLSLEDGLKEALKHLAK